MLLISGLYDFGTLLMDALRFEVNQAKKAGRLDGSKSEYLDLTLAACEFYQIFNIFFKKPWLFDGVSDSRCQLDNKIVRHLNKYDSVSSTFAFEKNPEIPVSLSSYEGAVKGAKLLLNKNRDLLEKADKYEKATGRKFLVLENDLSLFFNLGRRRYSMELLKTLAQYGLMHYCGKNEMLKNKSGLNALKMWEEYYKNLPADTTFKHRM